MKVRVHWSRDGLWTHDEFYVTEIIRPDLLRLDSRFDEPTLAEWNPETQKWEEED